MPVFLIDGVLHVHEFGGRDMVFYVRDVLRLSESSVHVDGERLVAMTTKSGDFFVLQHRWRDMAEIIVVDCFESISGIDLRPGAMERQVYRHENPHAAPHVPFPAGRLPEGGDS